MVLATSLWVDAQYFDLQHTSAALQAFFTALDSDHDGVPDIDPDHLIGDTVDNNLIDNGLLDSDLGIYAGITPSSDMQSFLGASSDVAARIALGVPRLSSDLVVDPVTTNNAASYYYAGSIWHNTIDDRLWMSVYAGETAIWHQINPGQYTTSYPFVAESDCSDNTGGECRDLEDGSRWIWNGSAMDQVQMQAGMATDVPLNETDPVVGAIVGIPLADGAGNISTATPDIDYLTPTGDGTGLVLAIAGCNSGTCSANTLLGGQTIDFGAASIDLDSATVTWPSGGFVFTSANQDPNVIGRLLYDNTVTGKGYGAFRYQNSNDDDRDLMDRPSGTAHYQKCTTIKGATSASDHLIERFPWAITIAAAHVMQLGATNVVGHFDECDANGANCAGIDGATDITAEATNANDDGSLSNSSIDAGDYIRWHTTSVSGTNTEVIVCFDYYIN